jgi:hypothetical protein
MNRKRRKQFFLFVERLVLYLKNSKRSTRKLLGLINTFSKIAGYEINIQKSITFLYANNEYKAIKKPEKQFQS